MSKHELAKFDPPKNYPKNMISFDGKLEPIKLSFEILKLAAELATKKI